MDITLHIGAHRCGTTTLQHFLNRNSEILSHSGIAVWTPERTRSGLFSGLIARPQDQNSLAERRAARSSGRIETEITLLRKAGYKQLLVTEENMTGSARNNLRQFSLYPSVGDRLNQFRRGFGSGCARIALSIRSYDDYWASAFAFAVAQGHKMPGPEEIAALVDQPRRWRNVIFETAAVFPEAEICVWPFERFGTQPAAQLEILSANAPLSGQLTGKNCWHNQSPKLPKLRRILRLRGEDRAADTLPSGNGVWMPFNAQQRLQLSHYYQADLAWLRGGADGLARLIEFKGLLEEAQRPKRQFVLPVPQAAKAQEIADSSRALAVLGRKHKARLSDAASQKQTALSAKKPPFMPSILRAAKVNGAAAPQPVIGRDYTAPSAIALAGRVAQFGPHRFESALPALQAIVPLNLTTPTQIMPSQIMPTQIMPTQIMPTQIMPSPDLANLAAPQSTSSNRLRSLSPDGGRDDERRKAMV